MSPVIPIKTMKRPTSASRRVHECPRWPTADVRECWETTQGGHLDTCRWDIQYREWKPLEGDTDACANESAIAYNIIILLTEKLRRLE
jgi:hypothetical protein